jgi:hypothetical protein
MRAESNCLNHFNHRVDLARRGVGFHYNQHIGTILFYLTRSGGWYAPVATLAVVDRVSVKSCASPRALK